MKIASGLNALMLSRVYNNNSRTLSTTTTRLASGLRINSAKDDAAGLAITERFTSQVRGMTVGKRNLNDALSMLQVADGGLSEVSSMLQRIRELSVRAAHSAVVGYKDRKNLELEASELIQEIQATFNKTEFNGVHILTPLLSGRTSVTLSSDGGSDNLLYALRASWLSQAENAIRDYFGIEADLNHPLEIVLDETGSIGAEGALLTAGSYDVASGLSSDLTLTLDMDVFSGGEIPNGGSGPLYFDRIIAREMTKAVMARNVETQALPEWFNAGVAELLIGGDERLSSDGGWAGVSAQDLTAWNDTSAMKSKAYLAARFINDVLRTWGDGGKTMADLFAELKTQAAGGGTDLLDAINTVTNGSGSERFNNMSHFMSKLTNYANSNYAGLDLSNADDVGAIGGVEADGANTRGDVSAEGVITDIEGYEENPTRFDITLPPSASSSETTTVGERRLMGNLHYMFQFGPNPFDTIQVDLEQFSTTQLGINNLSLVDRAQEAIVLIDKALDKVNESRARFGAQMNRVEHNIARLETNIESYSRTRSAILDADYAVEMSQFTKSMLLNNAANSMMAQANSSEVLVLSLLDQTVN